MKARIFLDTNVLISGIFFSGGASILLKYPDFILITSDVNYREVFEVAKRKFVLRHEIEQAFLDIAIVEEEKWKTMLEESAKYVKGKNDQKILAAVLFSKPDYFVTNDKHFHKRRIKKLVKIRTTAQILKEFEI